MNEWIENIMLHQEGNISPDDMSLLPITDDPEEVIKIINDFYSGHDEKLTPNYEL